MGRPSGSQPGRAPRRRFRFLRAVNRLSCQIGQPLTESVTVGQSAANLDAWLRQIDSPPIFLNSIGGLGSPFWRPGPEPVIVGEGNKRQKVTAVAESILFLLQANLDAMNEVGLNIQRLQISGGLANSDALCQRLADLTGKPVYRPQETEATARGAAWLAAGQPSHWPELEPGTQFEPETNPELRKRYGRFLELLET